MPQLDKLTYLSQFFWLCLLFFTFYILFFNNKNGILGISRILKLRNQLLSHRGNEIQSKDPKNLEEIARKGFSTGLSYMYSSLSEVSQWCKTVDYFGKSWEITLISYYFSEISGSRGMERQIPYWISKSKTYSSWITYFYCKNIVLAHVPHGLLSVTNERKMEPDPSNPLPSKPPLGPLSVRYFCTGDGDEASTSITPSDTVDPKSVQGVIETLPDTEAGEEVVSPLFEKLEEEEAEAFEELEEEEAASPVLSTIYEELEEAEASEELEEEEAGTSSPVKEDSPPSKKGGDSPGDESDRGAPEPDDGQGFDFPDF